MQRAPPPARATICAVWLPLAASKVTGYYYNGMDDMFEGAEAFNQPLVSDTSKLTKMDRTSSHTMSRSKSHSSTAAWSETNKTVCARIARCPVL